VAAITFRRIPENSADAPHSIVAVIGFFKAVVTTPESLPDIFDHVIRVGIAIFQDRLFGIFAGLRIVFVIDDRLIQAGKTRRDVFRDLPNRFYRRDSF